MIEVRDLGKPPLDIKNSAEKEAERVERFLSSRLRRFSGENADERIKDIESKLDKWYKGWDKQTKSERDRLKRYLNLIEGVVEDTNFPFEGASNITLHNAAAMARIFRAQFNKTAYQDENLFYPIFSPTAPSEAPPAAQVEPPKENPDTIPPEQFQALEAGFNHSFARLSNGISTLKDGTIPTVRDGTMVIYGRWAREVQRCFDTRTYRSLEEFQKDYPTPEDAGITPEEYLEIQDIFVSGTEQEPNELVVNFEYDFVKKDGPEYRVRPWAKFVRFPTFVRELDDCVMYGYEMQMSRETLELRKKRKEVYERGADKALKANKDENPDGWDKQMGFVEGITRDEDPKGRPIRYIDGVCMLDLDGDGVPEKYEFWFAPEEKALLKLVPYRLRKNVNGHVVFRMVRREDRLSGVSLIGDCEDLFNQIDVLVRHRNNVRILSTSPIFIGKSTLKDEIDLGRAESVIRPGLTFWVDDINNSIRQLDIKDLSTTGDSMDEQMMYQRQIELVFGPSQGQSGQGNPDDKRASGRKVVALLTQANTRIDDYIDEFMTSLPKLAELHAALLFQYSAERNMAVPAEAMQTDPTKPMLNGSVAFPIKWLAHPRLTWGVKRRSVQLTPEFAMQRLQVLMQIYSGLRELLAVGDPIATELWNRQVVASGEPQAAELLLSGQNLQKVQQAFQALAAQKPTNPDQAAIKAGKQAFHKQLGKHAADHAVGKTPGQPEKVGL